MASSSSSSSSHNQGGGAQRATFNDALFGADANASRAAASKNALFQGGETWEWIDTEAMHAAAATASQNTVDRTPFFMGEDSSNSRRNAQREAHARVADCTSRSLGTRALPITRIKVQGSKKRAAKAGSAEAVAAAVAGKRGCEVQRAMARPVDASGNTYTCPNPVVGYVGLVPTPGVQLPAPMEPLSTSPNPGWRSVNASGVAWNVWPNPDAQATVSPLHPSYAYLLLTLEALGDNALPSIKLVSKTGKTAMIRWPQISSSAIRLNEPVLLTYCSSTSSGASVCPTTVGTAIERADFLPLDPSESPVGTFTASAQGFETEELASAYIVTETGNAVFVVHEVGVWSSATPYRAALGFDCRTDSGGGGGSGGGDTTSGGSKVGLLIGGGVAMAAVGAIAIFATRAKKA